MLAPGGRAVPTVLFAFVLTFLTNFYLIFNIYAANVAEVSIRKFINDSYVLQGQPAGIDPVTEKWFWSLCLNSVFLGQAIGSFATSPLSELLGRRWPLLIGNAGQFVAIGVQVAAILSHFPVLFLIGRCSGYVFAMINGPAGGMVVVESIPPHLRGAAVFSSGLAYSVIGLVASVCATDLVLGHRLPVLFSLGLPFSGLALVMALWLKETPTYALLTAKDETKAKQSLLFYHGLRGVDVPKKLEEMRREEEELNVGSGCESKNGLGSSLSQIKDLLVKRHLRRAVLVSISILQFVVGPWLISTEILMDHFSAEMAEIFASTFPVVSLVAGIIGTYVVARLSRRHAIIGTAAASTACMALYIVSDRLAKGLLPSSIFWARFFDYGCLATLVGANFSSGICIDPLAFFIMGELLPQTHRSVGIAFIMFVFLMLGFLVSGTLLPVYETYGIYSFIPFVVLPSLLSVLYLHYTMPEVKNRTIHEIVTDLMK